MREYPPLPLGFPKASRVIHACGAHNEADFREFGEYEGERTAMPGEQTMFGWEVVYTKFFGVPGIPMPVYCLICCKGIFGAVRTFLGSSLFDYPDQAF